MQQMQSTVAYIYISEIGDRRSERSMEMKFKGKIVMVPYPALGHVTPLLNLASAFVSRGFHAVVVVPQFIHRCISTTVHSDSSHRVTCVAIPDGGGLLENRAESPDRFVAIEAAMENEMPEQLERLLLGTLAEAGEGGRIEFMVVDLLASWAIGVAERCGFKVAGFWPVMLTAYNLVAGIPELLRTGVISQTGDPIEEGPINFLPTSQPSLTTQHLPWLIGTAAARSSRFQFWKRTLHRTKKLRWLLVNTFPEETRRENNQEQEDDHPLILPVGPLVKPMRTENTTLSPEEEDYGCLEWLDEQTPGSVIYVSFGSWVNPIGVTELKGLTAALEASGRPFLWVLRDSWRKDLPENFIERVSRRMSGGGGGKVVSWAPQVEVLRHDSVGCFLTHCGWNSTVEALRCGKRLLCFPIAGDQFVNCDFIVNVWRVGIRVLSFDRKDLETSVKGVMEDGEMEDRVKRVKEMIMGEEVRSRADHNFDLFIEDLKINSQDLKSPLLSSG